MKSQKILVSGIVGGIVSFLAGWLIYGVLLMDFMSKNAGTATGVMRAQTEMVWWAVCVGSLFYGFVLSYIFNRWANIVTAGKGAMAGAVIFLLYGIANDLIFYGTTNLNNLTGTVVDIAAGTVMGLLVGATVGAVNGMGKKA